MACILVACEESQAVTIELRKLGHTAFSCDTQDCSGGHSEWHIKDDALKIIEETGYWDCMIAFPPCTYISYAATKYWNDPGRVFKRLEALMFFAKLLESPIKHIAIENPLGCADAVIRKHDQIINPYYFGDPHLKRTCLWLKNLPKLEYALTDNLFQMATATERPEPIYTDAKGKKRYYTDAITGSNNGGFNRSKTFPSIAKAMASQWGAYLDEHI